MSGPTLRARTNRTLRRTLPRPAYQFVVRRYADVRILARRNPGRGRLLPDFLLIGAAKAGTTSLYAWLAEHPFVVPAAKKEVHYFDYGHYQGEDWYRSHFPSAAEREAFVRRHGQPFLTGEASPSYLSHRWAQQRVAAELPEARLLVALRNPVDRAYSQYRMSCLEGEEELSFEEAIEREEERLRPELARVEADPRYNSWPIGCWSYLLRSRYAEHLERWLALFPRERFCFVRTEDVAASPQQALDEVHAFLGLPPHRHDELRRLHVAEPYEPMEAATRARLVDYFRPHNERLYELVGVDFGWER